MAQCIAYKFGGYFTFSAAVKFHAERRDKGDCAVWFESLARSREPETGLPDSVPL